MQKFAALSIDTISLSGAAIAQEMKSIPADTPLKWVDSTALPKGAQGVVLVGDPSKAEIVVVRSKFPPNYVAPPHTHPFTETITVISGEVGFGMDAKVTKTGEMAKPGAFMLNPAGHPHYVWTGDKEAIIQVQYTGPGGITYVNPEDDPRKK
jgi:quercetin dioxygenase-like cupin family protein